MIFFFFVFRPDDVKNQAEIYWFKVFECGVDASANTIDAKVKVKEEKSECLDDEKTCKAEKGLENDQSLDGVDDESQSGTHLANYEGVFFFFNLNLACMLYVLNYVVKYCRI